MLKTKILEIDELAVEINKHKALGKTVVLCHGCFDLLHIGHIRYLKRAKQMGDILLVTLSPDHFVDKGPKRPKFNEALRAEAIASLDCVDFVAINKWDTAEETLRLLKPDVYVKGSDFKSVKADRTGKLSMEAKVCKETSTKLAFTDDIVFSSTNLINEFFSSFPEEVRVYIALLKKRYSLDDILNIINKMSKLKVLVIGDTILDEYIYCHPLGASSKEPVLAVHYDSSDMFAGGILAIANHIANFASKVRLFTIIGEEKEDIHKSFIRSKLSDKVMPEFFVQKDAPTLIKKRYVDGYSLTKLLEIYIMNDSGLHEEEEIKLCDILKKEILDYDLVIVGDFGHGAISDNIRNIIVERSKFLAVNTQANAGNKRLHTISRYRKADYVSLAEPEIRLDTRNTNGDIRVLSTDMCRSMTCRNLAVTRGKKGSCIAYDKGEAFVIVPAFVNKVVDRIGSGDAFFGISAMASYLKAPAEIIGFIGNVVGSLAVEVVGNQKAVTKDSVEKYITSILK